MVLTMILNAVHKDCNTTFRTTQVLSWELACQRLRSATTCPAKMKSVRLVCVSDTTGRVRLNLGVGAPHRRVEVSVSWPETGETAANGWPNGWFEATFGCIDDPTFVRHVDCVARRGLKLLRHGRDSPVALGGGPQAQVWQRRGYDELVHLRHHLGGEVELHGEVAQPRVADPWLRRAVHR